MCALFTAGEVTLGVLTRGGGRDRAIGQKVEGRGRGHYWNEARTARPLSGWGGR